MSETEPLQAVADQVTTLCGRAGEAILHVYNRKQGFTVETKADDSPVTEADLAGHRTLMDGLPEIFPGVPVISEESPIPEFGERRNWHRYWLVDPLDGTKEFINRNGEFTVNVALIENGTPLLGVVHAPVLDTTYVGVRGLGARKLHNGDSRRIHTRPMASPRKPGLPVEVVVSRRHGVEAIDRLLKNLSGALGPLQTRAMGSSLKLCLVAEGRADLYPRLGPTSEWDTAAAQAVVEAAGGSVVDIHFDRLRYNSREDLLNPFFYVLGDPAFGWSSLLS